jgi:tryptophan halogenase
MLHSQSVCIVGGGTAGWMTAAALSNKFDSTLVKVTLIESDEIGTVGVGEATLQHIRFFNQALGIDERVFMRETNATFKLGIEFCDWGALGDRYIHPFGDYGVPTEGQDFHQLWLRACSISKMPRLDDYSYPIVAAETGRFRFPGENIEEIGSNFGYAYQFDSSLFAKFLRAYAVGRGVTRQEGKIVDATVNNASGDIKSVRLESGQMIDADIFIDCSGFRGLLIEQKLETGYDDWSNWLPCNRALAVPTESTGAPFPFTRATAKKAGWQWRIPLQHRVGNGHVYCNSFISDEDALNVLTSGVDGKMLAEPRQLFFTTGRRKKFWNRNVISIGLSAGFLEPLESTSIHLIQEGITNLIELFPTGAIEPSDIDEYNDRMALNFERVRDFLLLHYVATQRDDSDMWRHFRNLELPDSLNEKIGAWLSRGYVLPYEFGVFLPPSWIAVMLGQNLVPRGHDKRADRMDERDLFERLNSIRTKTAAEAASTPVHADFLKKYLASAPSTTPRAIK